MLCWHQRRFSTVVGNNPDVFRYLCALTADQGVDPGADDNAAIQWVVQYRHLNVVRYQVICLVTEAWIQLLLMSATPCHGQLPMWCDTCATYCYLRPNCSTIGASNPVHQQQLLSSRRLRIPAWPIPTPPRPHESQSISAGAARAGACVSRWYYRRLRHEQHQAAGSDSLR